MSLPIQGCQSCGTAAGASGCPTHGGVSQHRAAERGPNYDWKHETDHYRLECDKLCTLLQKVEASGEWLSQENRELHKLLLITQQRLGPAGSKMMRELKDLRWFQNQINSQVVPGTTDSGDAASHLVLRMRNALVLIARASFAGPNTDERRQFIHDKAQEALDGK